MKRLLVLLFLTPMLFNSCNGDDGIDGVNGTNGREGIDGIDGEDGVNGINGVDGQDNIGQVFNVVVNFTAANNYATTVNYPVELVRSANDVVLVFMWEKIPSQVQKATPPLNTIPPPQIWKSVPSTIYMEKGVLLFDYKFYNNGLFLFLDGTVNLDELSSEYLENISFKVAVIPAELIPSLNIAKLEDRIGEYRVIN